MIRFYAKRNGQLTALETAETSCWVDISPPFAPHELEEAAIRFAIPLDFLIDALDIDERSRYEKEEEARLILFNTAILNEIEGKNESIYTTIPIGIIFSLDHLITISPHPNPVLQKFIDGRVKHFNPEDESLFALQIMEQNVYRFLTCLKKLNHKRNLIENELYDSSRNRELKQLLSIEKSLVYFVNSLSSNDLLKMKMKRIDFLHIREDEEKMDLFEDIIIDNSQALEMANVYTNILHGTMEAYGSIISNNLNLTIRRLTTITIILMVPTLVASFFGMNIPLPWHESPWALGYIIAGSTVLSALVAWYFQKNSLF